MIAAVLGGAGYYVATTAILPAEPFPNETGSDSFDVDWCTPLRVVTASSFRPVLDDIAPLITSGEECVQLEVEVANGVDALSYDVESGAHVWIPDDAAWAGASDEIDLDGDAPGAGTVLATSPIYMVAGESAAAAIGDADDSWLGLANLLSQGAGGITLVVQDPARSGDGLVAAGSVAEAVWLSAGMDASAQALTAALPSMRIVEDDALPEASSEVGLVPEYALLPALERADDGSTLAGATRLAGTDHTATLRYTWLPTAASSDDPAVAAAAQRLFETLTSSQADAIRSAAGLRGPDPTAGAPGDLPPVEAAPFEVFSPHAVDHVFATFYEENRRADFLVVIDVSSSMAAPPPGSDTPILDLVKAGLRDMTELLPNDAQLGLWQFGSQLDAPRDWVELAPPAPLEDDQRSELSGALAEMVAIDTGTALYNTMLDAYLQAKEQYRPDVPSHVVVFTDGNNAFRDDSLTVEELTAALGEAHDPTRPVQLTIVAMGEEPDDDVLGEVLEPVESYLARINTADEVRAVLIHLAAGGVHH